ncbi:hypothetical protein BGZ75_003158, partial [Mortierella antarctica]
LERFDELSQRYLLYLTKSKFHRHLLEDELNKHKGTKLTWEQCETIFLRVALSDDERHNQVIELLNAGRKPNESYKRFAMRISRDIRVYGIADNSEMVLSILRRTVPNIVLDQMILMLKFTKGPTQREFKSITDFVM